ncbi:MBL fold metallo-hydrolase [Caballeronia arationis]|nr:MBL fold metallo-hydrolase [Caballeronia arationis]
MEDFGYLDRNALLGAGVKIVFAPTPSAVADHAFTAGTIPTISFEKVLAPTRMTVGVRDGIGCYPDKLPAEKQTAKVVPDDFQHELATCFNVKNRGLIVITSCSHRGVVNSVRRAVEVSGIDRVHAVIGGFHLAPQKADYVRETVAALKEINPDVVIPMHCTGETFIEVTQKECPRNSFDLMRAVGTSWNLAPRALYSDAFCVLAVRLGSIACEALRVWPASTPARSGLERRGESAVCCWRLPTGTRSRKRGLHQMRGLSFGCHRPMRVVQRNLSAAATSVGLEVVIPVWIIRARRPILPVCRPPTS